MRVCPRCKATYVAPLTTCVLHDERLIETDRDLLIGCAIGRYHVIEFLGSGGMGRVYRARHLNIDREYAIKVLYGDLARDGTFRARFQREAAAISRIRHPNVVSVSDFGTDDAGLSFIVMELLRGRTLLRAIESEGPMLPARAGSIARQIAEALRAAHAAGYVHRDVKSTNVMLVDDGSETVKVLDFGTVSLRQQKLDDRLTTVGQIIGTPAFMAPEQFEDPAVGPSADLYSLGVVVYHMLAGRLPFTGARTTELMVQHLTQPPPQLPACQGLEELVMRLLEKDPEERPSSAYEVILGIDSLILDGSTDGFASATEPVPVPPRPFERVMVFDRPPIAEADTPREDDIPTLRPDDSPTMRDTAPDALQSAATTMLTEDGLQPRPRRTWHAVGLGVGLLLVLVAISLLLK